MKTKRILRIFVCGFLGALITSFISALFWLVSFLIFPPGPSGGFLSFSSRENFVIGVLFGAILGLPIGVLIGLIVSIAELRYLAAALSGAVVCFAFPMLFVFAMAADSAARGAGGDKGMEWMFAAILIGPQSVIGALSGLVIAFMTGRFSREIDA